MNIQLTNTCPFDNLALGVFTCSKLIPNFITNLPNIISTPKLVAFLALVENSNWDKVKEFWIREFMGSNVKISGRKVSLWGSEDLKFNQYLSEFQSHKLLQVCNINCNLNGHSLREDSNLIFLVKKRQNNIEIYQSITGPCSNCHVLINTLIAFKNKTNFIIVQPANNINVLRFNDLPKEQTIDGKRFKLLCGTVREDENHFVAVFNFGIANYYVNAIGKQCELMPIYSEAFLHSRRLTKLQRPYSLAISSALYYLI